jgi:hypothetical protein
MITSTETTTVKAVTIRAIEGQSLNDAQIARACPAVFADHAHESRSSKYFFIPSKDILAAMREAGFFPTEVMQSGSRMSNGQEAAKHLMRFRQGQYLGPRVLHQEVPEVVMVNAHGGQSGYQFRFGMYRLACTNGLILGNDLSRINIHHRGQDDIEAIIRASYKIIEMSEQMLANIEQMKQIELPEAERLLFAKYAMMARFDLKPAEADESNIVEGSLVTADNKPVIWQPSDFLRRRRAEDRDNSLNTILNVVQENVLGPRSEYARPVTRLVNGDRKSVRRVKGIDQSLKINSLIGAFAEELRKLHS